MKLTYQRCATRRLTAATWVALVASIGEFWLGLMGLSLALVASTRWLRGVWGGGIDVLQIDPTDIKNTWISRFAVALDSRSPGPSVWLFKDEFDAAQWAALLRLLHSHSSAQVLGRSISN